MVLNFILQFFILQLLNFYNSIFSNPMKNGCSVFVGNIDFEVSRERILEELSAVGKVVNFKLMIDKNTGKSKGFGFCEYESPLIAEKAIKNLNISFNGRQVIVNYAENDTPQEKQEESNVLDVENIIGVLNNMDRDNLKEVLIYLKKMAIDQPTYFKDLLLKNSQLIYGLLYSFRLLNLVDEHVINDFIKSSFDIDDNKLQILERVRSIRDSEIEEYPEDIKKKLYQLREMIYKKINTNN